MVLAEFEKNQGVTINLPDTWEARQKSYVSVSGDPQAFVCEINLQSPYPSAYSSRTYLRVCMLTNDGVTLDVVAFSEAVNRGYGFPTVVYGDTTPFHHKNKNGMVWDGIQSKDIIFGTNSLGGPFKEGSVNVFVPLYGKVVWLQYFEPIYFATTITKPYSHGLSVFDSISVAE